MQDQGGERPKEPQSAHVDDWLRERLDPPRESVERVVRQALQASNSRPDRSRLVPRPLAAVATVLVLTIAVSLVVLVRNGADQGGTLVPTITNQSGRVELIRPNPGGDRMTVEESSRSVGPPVIFNEAGVTAAIIPGKEPRLLLRGGES